MTVRIMVGDALSQLATLPGGSVLCVVTSPPYWVSERTRATLA